MRPFAYERAADAAARSRRWRADAAAHATSAAARTSSTS